MKWFYGPSDYNLLSSEQYEGTDLDEIAASSHRLNYRQSLIKWTTLCIRNAEK